MSSDLLDWLIQHEPSFRKSAYHTTLRYRYRLTDPASRSRLPSLYSDLSLQRTTNPDGYIANITAWQTALSHAARANLLPSNSAFLLRPSDTLLTALSSPQYGRPLGLGAVIDESVRASSMIPVKEFLATDRSIYSKNWVPSPWTVLQWGLRQIGLAGTGSYEGTSGARKLKTSAFVLVEALEKVAAQVIAAREKDAQSLTDRVMNREEFAQNIATLRGVSVSDEDVRILLRFLERDKQALSYSDEIVKFKSSSSLMPEPITSQDTDIASLKSLISALANQCTTLSTRITTLAATASSSVRAGNRISALSALRSKKLAEKNLQQRSDTLHQLEEVFTRIEQAVDQIEIVKVMDASAGILRSLNKEIGGVENVENVVERLQEEMGKADEVGKVLEEPLNPGAVVDEGEIDEELEAMEEEDRREREEREAEATRKRLQELDKQDVDKKQTAGKQADVSANSQLEESTKRLSQMSIEDGKRHDRYDQEERQKITEET